MTQSPRLLAPAHLGAARKVPPLGLLVELGSGLRLRAAAPLAASDRRALLPDGGPRLLRHVGDRLLLSRRADRLLHVLASGAPLLLTGHEYTSVSARPLSVYPSACAPHPSAPATLRVRGRLAVCHP